MRANICPMLQLTFRLSMFSNIFYPSKSHFLLVNATKHRIDIQHPGVFEILGFSA